MKKNRKQVDYVKEQDLSKTDKEKTNEEEEVINDYKSSFNHNDIEDKSSTPNNKKVKVDRLN